MDPNETLRTALRCAATLLTTGPGADPAAVHDIADQLAEAVANLDEWLRRGGFLPREWQGPLTLAGETGHWVDQGRAMHRLETVFDRALRDDEVLDRLFVRDEVGPYRERLIKMLAREVVAEAERERAQLERTAASAVTRDFIERSARVAACLPAVLTMPQGFTAEGWEKLQAKRKEREG